MLESCCYYCMFRRELDFCAVVNNGVEIIFHFVDIMSTIQPRKNSLVTGGILEIFEFKPN
jgi:hypothetical protein